VNTCQIRLIGEPLQIEEQLDVFVEPRRHAVGPIRNRQRRVPSLAMRGIDPALDFTNRFEILVDAGPVAGTERALEPPEIGEHTIQQAAIGLHARQPLLPRCPIAEQPVEDHAGIVFDRQRRGRRLPRDRVQVCAAVPGFALSAEYQVDFRNHELERRHHRRLSELSGRDLVRGDAGADPRSFCFLRVHARQPGRAGARVFAIAITERLGLLMRETADDRHTVPVGTQRRQNRRPLEILARTCGRPEILGVGHGLAVGRVDEAHANCRFARGTSLQRQSRDHRIQKRQGHGDTESP